jgi:NADH:ubiquinone oxidoreductase subunit E
MLGIFTGLKITLQHLVGPKVTRLYPYEKRVMPPRMRGLIHYLRDANGQYKCEGCLFCEKICPPQAITVSYRQAETARERPQTVPEATWSNFRRSRRSLLSHQGRPELAVEQLQRLPGEAPIDWQRVNAAYEAGRGGGGLAAALGEIQSTVGFLPRHALTKLAEQTGVDLSIVYGMATSVPGYRTNQIATSELQDMAVCQCPVCRSAGAKAVAAAVREEVGSSGRLLQEMTGGRCLGDSRHAPVLRVGERQYGDVTPESARQIVRELLAVGGSPQ